MNFCGFIATIPKPMKANLSLYNAIFNVWMVAVYPSRQISVASVGWWTSSCHLPSCFALKTIPFRCEIVVTFFVSSVVHVSIRCIKSDVACTYRSNCRRKTLNYLRLFRGGYFKERRVKHWAILEDTNNMNESFHSRKCGQRQDLQFNLTCRLSRKPIPVASISLLFICTAFVANRRPLAMFNTQHSPSLPFLSPSSVS